MEPQEPQKNVLTVPIAIVVAGIIIGGAVFLSRGGPAKEIFKQQVGQVPTSITEDISLRAVNDTDHILGNPNAPIVMVEYSDLECPFCKSFHKTMRTILDQYGKTGSVAWVYRHFPLEIHPKSPKESEATECAFEQGGNDKFWTYTDKMFEITPANNQFDLTQLPVVAGQLGLDVSKFKTCLDSGKYASKVQADYDDGIKAGVNGTPNTILILTTPVTSASEKKLSEMNQSVLVTLPQGSSNVITLDSTKKKISIGGAFPLAMMKEIIDMLLSGK